MTKFNCSETDVVFCDSNSNQLQVGSISYSPYWLPWDFNTYHNHYHTWWPISTEMPINKIELAFKIVEELIKKNIIKVLSVKSFVELVNEISEII